MKKRGAERGFYNCRLEKKLSKKPRHLELQDVGLESPSTPVGGPSPANTPLGGLGPGSRCAQQALLADCHLARGS